MIENQNKAAWSIILGSMLFLGYIALRFEGTGDDGDSVLHYLFARWAYVHPEHHFQQWAKPIFVLLAAPVAQFGFQAFKIMNVMLFGASQFFAFAVAKKTRRAQCLLSTAFHGACTNGMVFDTLRID
jgi:hypothetical protein